MKAEITLQQGFRAAPEGHTTILYLKGEVVSGKIAEWALEAGAAKRIDEIAESLEHKSAPEAPEPQAEMPRRRGRPEKVI